MYGTLKKIMLQSYFKKYNEILLQKLLEQNVCISD